MLEEPVLLAPEVDVPGLSDAEVLADMADARVLHGREYARELESIARLARRRGGELSTADGRGGPGVDAWHQSTARQARWWKRFHSGFSRS